MEFFCFWSSSLQRIFKGLHINQRGQLIWVNNFYDWWSCSLPTARGGFCECLIIFEAIIRYFKVECGVFRWGWWWLFDALARVAGVFEKWRRLARRKYFQALDKQRQRKTAQSYNVHSTLQKSLYHTAKNLFFPVKVWAVIPYVNLWIMGSIICIFL